MKNKKIIFEDKDFLIINKPANISVHPLKSLEEKTLVSLLINLYPEIKKIDDPPASRLRPGIVHRLDKDVSGLMIIARNQKSFEHFKKEFKNRRIEKEYLALVHGHLPKEKGVITLPLTRSKKGITLAKKIDLEKIKEAWTEYEVLKNFKNFSLLKIKTRTGRTHQIRVHSKTIGHPIVGDEKYKIKRQKVIPLGRIFLHAYKLGFYDLKGHWQEFKIDLPIELKNFLKKCEK